VTEREAVADPASIWRIIHGFSAYFVAVAAVRLGIFDALAVGPLAVPELAKACRSDADRTARLCEVLAALDLLRSSDGRFALTPESEAFLLSGAPRSMRELIVHSPGPWENWPALDATIRGAPSPRPVDSEFYLELGSATFPTQFAAARATAGALGGITRLLDLGAGSASWTIALLLANPTATAVVNDLPAVIDMTRDRTLHHGVAERCEFRPGDYFTLPLPDAEFDVVLLAHVLRAESADGRRSLIERAVRALRPGGAVVIAEYFVQDDRRGPLNALMLGITMMAATPSGGTLTYADCRKLLGDGGIAQVDVLQAVPFQEVMIGRKAGGSS
jgi:SAM-dependent methyltransferase